MLMVVCATHSALHPHCNNFLQVSSHGLDVLVKIQVVHSTVDQCPEWPCQTNIYDSKCTDHGHDVFQIDC